MATASMPGTPIVQVASNWSIRESSCRQWVGTGVWGGRVRGGNGHACAYQNGWREEPASFLVEDPFQPREVTG